MEALIERAAQHGPPFNLPERCEPVKGTKFYEFKTWGHRIFWLFSDNRIVLFYGYAKKSNAMPKRVLKQSQSLSEDVQQYIEGEKSK